MATKKKKTGLENVLQSIGKVMLSRREGLKLTKTELAKSSGISVETISNIENGTIKNLSFKVFFTLSEALNLKSSVNIKIG